jgi:hypothetical protein
VKFFSFTKATFRPERKRPYEIISEALQAWDADDAARADQFFRRGIAAYQSNEPDGVDFALGRYGAFLLDQGRIADAERVLQQAIELKTDIPAIRSDYIGIFAARHDIEAFKNAVARLDSCRNGGPVPEFSLRMHDQRIAKAQQLSQRNSPVGSLRDACGYRTRMGDGRRLAISVGFWSEKDDSEKQ